MENTSTLQKAPKKGLNTAILILQFIGIVAVVLGHADGPGEDVPNFLTLAFPYYSWHMPFFIFISGYLFNREQTAGSYILKKVKTHLIPALIVNAICGIFAVCIKAWDIAKYGADITLEALFVTPFTTGYQFFINVSLWFIFALFVIEVVACLLDRVTRGKADWIFLIVFCVVSLVCAYLPYVNHDGTRDEFLNATLRNGYLFFFFWLGVCYKKYAEKYVAKYINWKLSIGIFLVQALFLVLSDYTITTNVRNMVINTITVPNGYWTALVAPITATLFFMGIANSLAPYLQGSKTLALVGRNTRYIVYWH